MENTIFNQKKRKRENEKEHPKELHQRKRRKTKEEKRFDFGKQFPESKSLFNHQHIFIQNSTYSKGGKKTTYFIRKGKRCRCKCKEVFFDNSIHKKVLSNIDIGCINDLNPPKTKQKLVEYLKSNFSNEKKWWDPDNLKFENIQKVETTPPLSQTNNKNQLYCRQYHVILPILVPVEEEKQNSVHLVPNVEQQRKKLDNTNNQDSHSKEGNNRKNEQSIYGQSNRKRIQ